MHLQNILQLNAGCLLRMISGGCGFKQLSFHYLKALQKCHCPQFAGDVKVLWEMCKTAEDLLLVWDSFPMGSRTQQMGEGNFFCVKKISGLLPNPYWIC